MRPSRWHAAADGVRETNLAGEAMDAVRREPATYTANEQARRKRGNGHDRLDDARGRGVEDVRELELVEAGDRDLRDQPRGERGVQHELRLAGVLREALSVGTPVVATDSSPAVREIVSDPSLGEVVPRGDAAALLAADPALAEGFRTLERLLENGLDASARPALWSAALALSGEAMPWGLGTGGFSLAAGFGERRGLYPHNHALEALVEGGLPGLALWLLAFGGGLLLLLRRLPRLSGPRAAALVALVLPMAISVMVSTDLGNRMAWFALGLALSAAVEAEARHG